MKNTSRILLFSILLIGCFFLIHSNEFAFPARGISSDITVTHYPNAIFIRSTIFHFGQIPLWNPSILGGYPFISDPLSGLLYFPLWLALFLPLPFAFNLLIYLHWGFSSWGMYRLMVKQGLHPEAALIGAVMWMCLPKIWTHFAAGHITLLMAVSWTPWLLLSIATVIYQKRNRSWLFPGLITGMIALADIRWVSFALLLSFGFSFFTKVSPSEQNPKIKKILLLWCLIGIISLAISSVLLIPLFNALPFTNRVGMGLEDITALSLPWTKLSGMILPIIGENAESTTYMGIGGLLCLVLAIASPKIRARTWFWLAVFFVAIFFAIAAVFQPVGSLYSIIGLGLTRVPARAILLAGFAVCFITAICVDAILHQEVRRKYDPALFISGMALAPVVICVGIWLVTGQVNLYLLIIAAISISICGWIIAGEHGVIAKRWWVPVLFGLILVDLLSYDLLSVRWRTSEEVISEGRWAAEVLPEDSAAALYRTYSPSYSIPQQTAALAGIQMADGINPLQVENFVDFMAQNTGIPVEGYSVTIPSFSSWSIVWDNAGYLPDVEGLGTANVCYVVSRFSLTDPDLELLENPAGEGFLYQNTTCQPRIRLEDPDGAVLNGSHIQVERYTPNSISLTVCGPGRLVVADNAFPGWIATINGQRVDIAIVNGWMRSVEIPTGESRVEFIYMPWQFFLGLAVSILSLICCGVLWLKWK